MKKLLVFVSLLIASTCTAEPFEFEKGNAYVTHLENGKKKFSNEQYIVIGPDKCLYDTESGKRITKIVEINKERIPQQKEYYYCNLKESDRYWKESVKQQAKIK